jgi:acetyltransferase-like isoleucine patch superfamily enzyme
MLTFTGVRIGSEVRVGPGCEIHLGSNPARRGAIQLGDRTRIDRGVLLHPYGGRIETGIDVYIGPFTTVYGHGGVVIGKDTLISMHCRILSSNHSLPPIGTIIRSQGDVLLPTQIGRDVWLGAGVTVLGGITIGDGCVVGAGAVVTKDLPAGSIAHGVPAVVRGVRPQDR